MMRKHWRIQGGSGREANTPLALISFFFTQSLGKRFPNKMVVPQNPPFGLAALRLENPGSATAKLSCGPHSV